MASGFPDWLRATALLGQYLADYKVVAVDVNGNLYALLQGETAEGVLQTVRLDSEGRISAFVIDSTDAWGRMLSIGNAELAARLGSAVKYDRRGQAIFIEDFENGWAQWRSYTQGVGAAAELTPTTASHGGYCAKLTGGSTLGRYSFLRFTRGILPVGRVGIEMSFALPGAVDFLIFSLTYYTMTSRYSAKMYFVYADKELQIDDADAGMVAVGTAYVSEEDLHVFNTIKLVTDLTTGQYVRLLYNQQEIDISAYGPSVEGYLYPNRVSLDVGVYSRNGENDVMYLDDVIFTMAEPE